VIQPAPVVVTLPAEIDTMNAELAAAELTATFEPGVTLVIADMTATAFCDTSGLRALVRAYEDADGRGIPLRFVVRPDGLVRRSLQLTGIVQLLPVYASLDDAVRGD
jgi:anti-anti-sigma factor